MIRTLSKEPLTKEEWELCSWASSYDTYEDYMEGYRKSVSNEALSQKEKEISFSKKMKEELNPFTNIFWKK